MKRTILILTTLCFLYLGADAGSGVLTHTPNGSTAPKQWLFNPLSASDVSLEVERIDGDIMCHLYSQNMRNVEMIYVEKSTDPNHGFVHCKSIRVADHMDKSKSYINVVDDLPYSASVECYYRIRAVYAAGATKVYAPVSLSPIIPIEPADGEK